MVVYTRIHLVIVSIHTPTQGVTNPNREHLSDFLFQSTHPRRVWRWVFTSWNDCWCFNPHTHAGCDFPALEIFSCTNSFNPHTHAGCDSPNIRKIPYLLVSIHTPTQGVTVLLLLWTQSKRFQSTHPRRVWLILNDCVNIYFSFNPHTHAGCDKKSNRWSWLGSVSIHTPTQGVTIFKYMQSRIWIVSIHTPTQGVTYI